jgi:uncharacterized protein CbrC (UPF0167 family)
METCSDATECDAKSTPFMQGAIHTLCAARPTPKAIQEGWRVGFIYCRKQESYAGLSKSKANDLMQEVCSNSPISNLLQNLWLSLTQASTHAKCQFFAQRRQERAQEVELLQDRLEDLDCNRDANLNDKEWISVS